MRHTILRVTAAGLSALLLGGLAGVAPADDRDESREIRLVYSGSGSVATTETTLTTEYHRHSGPRYGTAQTMTRREFSGSGEVEIADGRARIRLPRPMMPLLRGDNDGWFSIEDLFVNHREITGSVRINALNKPKVRIDRMSGLISIQGGLSDFSGQCDPVDRHARRRF